MGNGEAWYESRKSSLTPPSWVFKLVWPSIYLGLAFAFYGTASIGTSSLVYPVLALNLLLAAFWPLVFVKRQFQTAFAMILVMLLSLGVTLYLVMKTGEKGSGWYRLSIIVFSLYLLWLMYAAVLSASFI